MDWKIIFVAVAAAVVVLVFMTKSLWQKGPL